MVRKTRKLIKKSRAMLHGMNIPQIRRAFERIDSFVKTHGKNVGGFRKEWKKVFGKDVSAVAAQVYIDDQLKSSKQKKSKKVQRGGVAPINYDLRSGTDIPYGSFPKYVSDGFGFANEDSIASVCGKENITATPPASLGSNKVGGGKGRRRKTRKTRKSQSGGDLTGIISTVSNNLSAMQQRPFLMNSPPTMAQQSQMAMKGYEEFPSGNPLTHTFDFSTKEPVYSAYLNPQSVQF